MHNQHQLAVWQQQRGIARYILLGTVITTVIDILLLFTPTDFYIPYCAFVPYFLTGLGFMFDGLQVSTLTFTGALLAFFCLSGYLLVRWFAKKYNGWLLTGLILVCVDTLVMVLTALCILHNTGDFILDILLHLAVIYELAVGLYAGIQLKKAESVPPSAPWDDQETTAESEYSEML